MIGIALTVLRFAWPFLLLGGMYLWADEGWHNAVAHRAEANLAVQEKALSTLRGQVAEMDRLAKAQSEQWAAATAAEQELLEAQDAQRSKVFAGLKNRARSSTAGKSVGISDGTKRLLGDAYAAAGAAEAAPVPDTAPAADSETVSDLIVWSVDILDWAATCKATVEGWQKWYSEVATTNLGATSNKLGVGE